MPFINIITVALDSIYRPRLGIPNADNSDLAVFNAIYFKPLSYRVLSKNI